MLAAPESCFHRDVVELLLLPVDSSWKRFHLMGQQEQQKGWWEEPCGGVVLMALHLSGFQVIQQ